MKNILFKRPWIIILVTLLLLTIVLALGNQSNRAIERAAFDEFNRRQLVLAKGAASGIELYFESLAGELRAMGKRAEIQHLDEAPTRQELQHLFGALEPLGVNDVAVLDADGFVRYSVTAPELEGADFSWQRYYQKAKGSPSSDTNIIQFVEFKGVEAREEDVLVAIPIFQTTVDENYADPSGQFAGIVVSTLKVDTITKKFVAPVRSSDRGHALLIDAEHHVLWAPDKSLRGKNLLEESTEFPAFQELVARMSDGHSGTTAYSFAKFDEGANEYVSDEPEEKLMAYSPIDLGGELWTIGVWAPLEDARHWIRSAYRGQLLVMGVGILIILLGSSCALMMTFRINRLLEQEVEIKTGELRESHERLQAAWESLEEAHTFQQTVMDGVAELIVVVSRDYRVRMMNRAARGFFHGDTAASEPLYCYQVSHQREAPCKGTGHPCPLEAVRQSRRAITVVHEHHQANGERRLVEVIASPLWGPDGEFDGIVEAVRDITERVRAEEALRASESKFRQLFYNANDAVYLWALEKDGMPGRCIEVNDVACRMLGYSRDELLTMTPEDIDAGEVVPEIPRIMKELAAREHLTFEMIHESKDGRKIPVEISSHIFAINGKKVILSITRDISERKRAEEALQRYAERLRALAAQLAEASEAERQRLARELHDQVGQNLTALGINLNIVRTQMPEETETPVLAYLEDSMALVEQTTERIRNVMADLRPPVLDDYGLVAALHWYGERFSRRTGIAVTVEGEEPMSRHPPRVESALFRVAQEALTNVAKHAQATQVMVVVEADDTTMHLSVVDDGIGFDPARQATPDGSGRWGLLTMAERAEAVGGRFRIESAPGEGTQVIVEVHR